MMYDIGIFTEKEYIGVLDKACFDLLNMKIFITELYVVISPNLQ